MSNNYDEATKSFYSGVSGRTRARKDAYKTIREGTYYTSQLASHREHKRRKQNVGFPIKSSGNKSIKEPMIERIDESELTKKHISSPRAWNKSAKERINNSEFKGKNMWSASHIKEPMIERIDESELTKKHILSPRAWNKSVKGRVDESEFTRKNMCSASRIRRSPIQGLNKGYENEDSGIQIIDKDYMSYNSCSMSKIRSSMKEKSNASSHAATPRNSEDACHGSDRAWPHESTTFIHLESDSDDSEVKGIVEARFRNQKAKLESKIQQSAEQILCTSCCSKSFDGAKKKKSFSDHSVTFIAKANGTVSDILANNTSTRKDIKGKGIANCELKNGKSSTTSKRGAFSRRGYSAVSSRKNSDIVKEVCFDNYCISSSEDADGDSHKEQADGRRQLTEKASSDEDMDLKELGIERIDESEFRKRRHSDTAIGPSTSQEPIKGHSTSNPANNVKRVSRNCVRDEVDSSSSSEFLDSSCSESDGNDVISLQHEDVSSRRAKHEKGPGVASRTRSKIGNIKKPKDVGNVSSSSSIDSDSSPTHSSNDENFEVESSDDGIEVVGSNIKLSDVHNISMKISADTRDCSKDESGAEQSKDSTYEQPSPINQKFTSWKRQPSNDASSKTEEDKPQKKCKVLDSDTLEKAEATCSERVHAHEMKAPIARKKASSECNDLFNMLADVVLERRELPENKEIHEESNQPSTYQMQDPLPLKFRFEDEVPPPVEKTESEKEIEELFSELDRGLEELRSFDCPEVVLEVGNSTAEETQHARCSRGKHELVLRDDEGLICMFCRHVELGPKDILPEWVERTFQGSERKRYHEMEEPLEFDELNLHRSNDEVADFGSSGTVWSIKPGVRGSMYEHQREGFEFLWKNLAGSINLDELKSTDPGEVGGCIISHAPGTGKTRLTIVFLETYLKMYPNCRPMIISPASMLLTWEEEFKKWDFEFTFINLSNLEFSAKEKVAAETLNQAKSRDSKTLRMIKISSWSKKRSILGISYSLFEKLTGERIKKAETPDNSLNKFRKILLEKPGLVVLDEGHTPRNQRSSIWNVLLKLQTGKRIILSGTPFQNNFGELFNTLRIVRPAVADVIAKQKTFADMVSTRRRPLRGESSMVSQVVDAAAVEKLKICMLPFVHVHKGYILQQSLPGLRDCVVLLKPPSLQKSLIERIEGSNNFKFEHDVALISVHPYLFKHCESREAKRIGVDMGAVEVSKLNPQEGVKTKFLVELIRLSMAAKEKILVFSQYIQPLHLIKDQCKEVFQWVEGRQILQMQGNVDLKQRQVLINKFNDPQSESKVMLASTKCCSEGISLIGASRVVLVDVVWNPSVERQAISRAYRIGQKKFVYTYHLMTAGTTEADKYCRQAEKERLSELVFSSSNESSQQKHPSSGIEDRILEVMVRHQSLKGMFEKIINQPKDIDLIQTFGLTS